MTKLTKEEPTKLLASNVILSEGEAITERVEGCPERSRRGPMPAGDITGWGDFLPQCGRPSCVCSEEK